MTRQLDVSHLAAAAVRGRHRSPSRQVTARSPRGALLLSARKGSRISLAGDRMCAHDRSVAATRRFKTCPGPCRRVEQEQTSAPYRPSAFSWRSAKRCGKGSAGPGQFLCRLCDRQQQGRSNDKSATTPTSKRKPGARARPAYTSRPSNETGSGAPRAYSATTTAS
jgi:hypothetical protein